MVTQVFHSVSHRLISGQGGLYRRFFGLMLSVTLTSVRDSFNGPSSDLGEHQDGVLVGGILLWTLRCEATHLSPVWKMRYADTIANPEAQLAPLQPFGRHNGKHHA